MVSIKDIARKAGVSISTVSYALNGNPKVTPETSARIRAIAKEMNYIPNGAARQLKKRESRIIGAFLTDFTGAFYGDLLQGMKEVLNRKGYDLIVCSGLQSHRLLPERMIDGAIILDSAFSDEELLDYADRGHRLVVLDRELNHPAVNQVLLDNKAGANLAMDYLIETGHRRLYIVAGPSDSFDARQRMGAVRQTLDRHPELEATVLEGDFNQGSGEAAGRLILEQWQGPAGVFCLNDEMAIGLFNAVSASDSGIRVGEELSLVGFDNIALTRYIQPRLATIEYSKYRWGAMASEQLLRMIAGEEVEHERIYVSLVESGSVKDRR
ncbi:LacI family DNA-binding transcriptional regulator [Paenibacillus pasadenensis]|uniref:Transcriptional regulator n=1 Tax=Paenibacillus pasadenensis TaxID=217090 RepID=A0A2N5NA50_9BACL|nr:MULTISPECIES: LacI family DNA-binding transcriptional regulator [Paenibacillus]PLT47160.1 Transcriptional regulator [Paenibacillus pasadenensis]QGG57484.1 LacI family DNA-binding transcriptional regulator [Paenibacillus sp. B01]